MNFDAVLRISSPKVRDLLDDVWKVQTFLKDIYLIFIALSDIVNVYFDREEPQALHIFLK